MKKGTRMLKLLGDFLLDEWLWNMTWGWHQIVLSLIFMWMLLVFIGWMRSIPALLLTITSYLFAYLVFSGFVVGTVIYFFEWKYITQATEYVPLNVMSASIWLGVIYSMLQGSFFFIVNKWYRLALVRVLLITVMSNIGAALLAAFFINVAG